MNLTCRSLGALGASLLTASLARPPIAQPTSTLRYMPISDLTGIDRGCVKALKDLCPIWRQAGRVVPLQVAGIGHSHSALHRRPEPVSKLSAAREH